MKTVPTMNQEDPLKSTVSMRSYREQRPSRASEVLSIVLAQDFFPIMKAATMLRFWPILARQWDILLSAPALLPCLLRLVYLELTLINPPSHTYPLLALGTEPVAFHCYVHTRLLNCVHCQLRSSQGMEDVQCLHTTFIVINYQAWLRTYWIIRNIFTLGG